MRRMRGGRGLWAGLERWALALTAVAIVAGPPVLMVLGEHDPVRILDFSVPGVAIVYFGLVALAVLMLIDPPVPCPSVHRTSVVVRALLIVSGWAMPVSMVFLLGANSGSRWLPDVTHRDPVTGEIDFATDVPIALLVFGGLGLSVCALAGAFLAILITGRKDRGAGPAAGTDLAHRLDTDHGQGC